MVNYKFDKEKIETRNGGVNGRTVNLTDTQSFTNMSSFSLQVISIFRLLAASPLEATTKIKKRNFF